MRKLRLAVLVSGSGRTLQNFMDLSGSDSFPGEVVLAIGSREGLGGIQRAVVGRVPHAVVARKGYADVQAFSDEIFRRCDEMQADLILLAGWLCLLQIPPRYDGRLMNIHPSLLPSFGGKGMFGHHVHEAVLAAGVK